MSSQTTKNDWIELDGSEGEGGGQILRSSLALSLHTGRPFRITKIRAGRKKPGLLRQHLTAVEAAKQVGNAEVQGAELRSTELSFAPTGVFPGTYHFAVGTAGSATLVLQTVLPALLLADGPSRLRIEGGTHNPFAPPYEFLEQVYLPQIRAMGPRVESTLVRHGFFPAGGGAFTVRINPTDQLQRLDLPQRGKTTEREATAKLAHIDRHVGERELKSVQTRMGWKHDEMNLHTVQDSAGPGNVLLVRITSEHANAVFVGFGEKGRRAETVAHAAVEQARAYLAADVPVCEHLADQLLLPMAFAGGGSFRTTKPSRHTLTHAEIIERFMDCSFSFEREGDSMAWLATVNSTP